MSGDSPCAVQPSDGAALEARRAKIVARYGSVGAALAPCLHEVALQNATWRHLVRGDPSTGPSLMGWKEGLASAMPFEVLCDVTAAIRWTATAADTWAEHRHWQHRAEVHAVLGGAGLPLWVRARRAVVVSRMEVLRLDLPDEAAREEWRRLAGEDPDIKRASAPAARPDQGEAVPLAPALSHDPEGGCEAVQSGHPPRTREEAREAVRALLVEGLTDREIARRIGVSPSTVGAVRKAVAGAPQDGPAR